MFTKEDLKLIEKHLPTIKTIIRNQSFSQIDNEFKMDIYTIAENNGISYCRTCNGSLYTTIGNIWLRYNKEIMEKAKNKVSTKSVSELENKKSKMNNENGYSEAKQDITSNNEVKRSNENGEGNKKESRGSRGRRSK